MKQETLGTLKAEDSILNRKKKIKKPNYVCVLAFNTHINEFLICNIMYDV